MIVKRLSDIVPERVGDFKRWYLSKAEPGHQLSVRYIEVNGIVPPHSHAIEETLVYVEGTGLASVGEREVAVKPGTMLVIPPGAVHSSITEVLGPFDTSPSLWEILTFRFGRLAFLTVPF